MAIALLWKYPKIKWPNKQETFLRKFIRSTKIYSKFFRNVYSVTTTTSIIIEQQLWDIQSFMMSVWSLTNLSSFERLNDYFYHTGKNCFFGNWTICLPSLFLFFLLSYISQAQLLSSMTCQKDRKGIIQHYVLSLLNFWRH